jgi:hypothetical protein
LIETDHGWQAHIEAPHHPPFLRVRLHPRCSFRKHSFQREPSHYGTESTFRLGEQGLAANRQGLIVSNV